MTVNGEREAHILAVVSSRNLGRGGDMGYGLVVSTGSILGARKPDDLEDFEAYFEGSPSLVGPNAEPAQRIAELLRAHKDFEVRTSSVGQLLIRRPSLLNGGYLILKMPLRSLRIDITVLSTQSPFLLETSERLFRALFQAVGSRLYDGATGIPYETMQQVVPTVVP